MYILFDIGATKMRVAATDGKSLNKNNIRIVPTPDSFVEGMALFKKLTDELLRGKKIQAAAGGIAGSVDRARGILLNPPNIPDWKNRPLRATLQKLLGTKNIFIENDTALVGLGEATNGAGLPRRPLRRIEARVKAGKGKTIVAYITASTGVNGVRVVDGKIDRSAMGFEIGHQIVGPGRKNTLESYVGAQALSVHFGRPAKKIRDPKIWEEIRKRFSFGVYNTILHWSPDIVVLGGGTVRAGDITAKDIEMRLKKILTIFPKCPPIKKAALVDLGGLWGALEFLRQQLAKI